MNLIEKLIEAKINMIEQSKLFWINEKDLAKLERGGPQNKAYKYEIDQCDTRLTDLRNALQEYREMCKGYKNMKAWLAVSDPWKQGSHTITEHPLKELKNPKNPG